MPSNDININSNILKVDNNQGLVLGWGIVCKVDGEDYVDLQGDHITELAMLNAAVDFMKNSRIAKDMHVAGDAGVLPGLIVFAFPLTTEIAKAFGISVTQTGLMIGMKPESDEILNKFKSGEYTGFSIGGSILPGGSREI